ncbi:hypothetical protein BJ878DRAFT_427571 [Calycina marina]|uniref:DUF1989 domain-containing protein n=1 Tax=Calycina marina TaxID=1763456 RepID=A0A9P7YXS8_9HELO|nr:hypothetical protein BJ878DRAFT_427571 [Calycina marina]
MSHTASISGKICPGIGNILYDNERKVLLRWMEDMSPGMHGCFAAACDKARHENLGVKGHKNCAENLVESTPQLLTLFMDVPINEDRQSFRFGKCTTQKGAYIYSKAEVELMVVMSA